MADLRSSMAASTTERHPGAGGSAAWVAETRHGLLRRSAEQSINTALRGDREHRIRRKVIRASCLVGAAGLVLSNAAPGAIVEPGAAPIEVQLITADLRPGSAPSQSALSYEMMLRSCRSGIDGSFRGINDAIRQVKPYARSQHIVSNVFQVDSHLASVTTMFRVADARGLDVIKEVRAEVALPSCAVSKLSFAQA